MAAVTICSDFGAPQIKSLTVSFVSPRICHEVMGPDAMILVFWMLSFKPTLDPVMSWRREVSQFCPTLWDPMDCSLPDSSLHGILQARVLEWVAISFSRESSQPRHWTRVSCIPGRRFNLWATREAPRDRQLDPVGIDSSKPMHCNLIFMTWQKQSRAA